MIKSILMHLLFAAVALAVSLPANSFAEDNTGKIPRLKFQVKLDTVLEHDDRKSLWFHPRVAAIPGFGNSGEPAVIMTLQKHLRVSDHYTGSSVMRTNDLGATWSKPDARPELAWVPSKDGSENLAVIDVTPGWHALTGKMIAIGSQTRYAHDGTRLANKVRQNQTSYSIYDPETNKWTGWRELIMPADPIFNFCRCASSQWLVEPDNTLLLAMYLNPTVKSKYRVAVVRCSFDGKHLKYIEHGNVLQLDVERGLVEPSLVKYQNKYYMTIRNDVKGYVTTSQDGLHYAAITPWNFDDGSDLGSYNTQQHWLVHSEGLFLTYTRRGAKNDHIIRNRAPLFIAQVDPNKLQVLRDTEQTLIPERGAALGNFGAAAITADESWVTVGEGVWNDAARKRGAKGAVFVSRVIWSKPNLLVHQSGQ